MLYIAFFLIGCVAGYLLGYSYLIVKLEKEIEYLKKNADKVEKRSISNFYDR